MVTIEVTNGDVRELTQSFPGLAYDRGAKTLAGTLEFCARYDPREQLLTIDEKIGGPSVGTYIHDSYKLFVRLEPSRSEYGNWPTVFEVGGRHREIAEKCRIQLCELHVDEHGACCLGIQYSQDASLTLIRFFRELVIPFFYRLSFIELPGIEVARRVLWGEYAHGTAGIEQHLKEMGHLDSQSRGKSAACPCGSGATFRKCCLSEVEAVKRISKLRS